MVRTHRLSAILIVFAALLSGCATKMIPPPIIYASPDFDPYAALDDDQRTPEALVFYATDRAPTASKNPSKAYGSSRGGSLRLGQATVRLGKAGGDWDALRRAASAGERPPVAISDVTEFGPLWTTVPTSDPDFRAAVDSVEGDDARGPAERFAREINEALERSQWSQIVIYVHGFNTPFGPPVELVAQLGHFMARDGVFLSYSWPASSHPFAYSKDRETARESARKLRELIRYLSEHTTADRIHLLSYSAGAPVVTGALTQLRLMHASTDPEEITAQLRLGHVIYAGADEDLDVFRGALLDRIDQVAESITIYMSDIDNGLSLSSIFTTRSVRLGKSGAALTMEEQQALREASRIRFIDVTSATRRLGSGDLFQHSYWYGNPWASTDLMLTFLGLSPKERGLEPVAGGAGWEFPVDYPERVRALAKEIQAVIDDEIAEGAEGAEGDEGDQAQEP